MSHTSSVAPGSWRRCQGASAGGSRTRVDQLEAAVAAGQLQAQGQVGGDDGPHRRQQVPAARLVEAKVLLPGATVLARAVAAARDRAADRLYATVADTVTDQQRARLDDLLEVPTGEQLSRLEAVQPRFPPATRPRVERHLGRGWQGRGLAAR